ncbi:MAG: 16S rRNA (adenine(1518)-N(6)/adenine(1519)-N(6))-dimethyltransferase RsmA [Eubacteriales bacterium]|nr:16S rRNA (adenine(1518)-N(6)/adenine(1519)-N(6))-dimethyltransferase RsmA [Eubacteriales bacterium]MDY5345411.1 16S rRNA (adenine(1518)-N(6)/adenine(1519)-N(6))-dimethyltransferase RsmA [Eubacteriales bacterium]
MSDLNVKDILISKGFHYNKALGQNFITDGNLLSAIVSDSGVDSGDTVVEIGTGAGTLTRAIAAKAKKVFSFELDKNLISVLDLSLKGLDNVEVIFKDVLKMTDGELKEIVGGEFKVVANLPYYVTTPMIMRFLESGLDVKSITVMVQKEVADRFIATVGSKEYAAVSLAVQMRGEARVTRIVGRQMFFPMPNVDSAVVKIDVDKNKLHGVDLSALSRLVRISFAMRRKMLTNNLMSGYGLSREKAIDVLLKADISPTVRGEALSLDQYVKVLNVLKDFGTK